MNLDQIAAAASVLELAAIEHTEARARGDEAHIEITRRRLDAARAALTETARAAIALPSGYHANLMLAADYIRSRSKARMAPGPKSGTMRHTRLTRLESALREYARAAT